MKKIQIIALHLGFGGIEKCIASLANSLVNVYDIEIVSLYKLYDKPPYELNKKIKVKYLINSDIALRTKEYKALVKKGKILQCVGKVFKDYSYNVFKIIGDVIYSIYISLVLKKSKIVKYIKNSDADVIISTRDMFNVLVGKYAKDGVKKIAWEHNHHHGNMKYANNLIESFKNMDIAVLVSKSLSDYYSDILNNKGYKCVCKYIPNSLDYIPQESSNLRNKNIVSVGRLEEEKGYETLIEVMDIIHKRNKSVHLNIIGDGTQKDFLNNMIKEYQLEDCVKMHGYLNKDEIDKVELKSSVYVMTSYTESFGLVLLEAMSLGIPCVAFDSAEGANDLIKDDITGYLVKNRDVDKMAEVILDLLNNYDQRVSMGNCAKENSYNYDISSVKSDWIKII